ncbi:MAG TPA: hypothetical protein VGS80_16930 [Ktedonobacterales bacterium]|nr:hypothetical protein [Ktedonobacterales bacterium]
MPSTVPAYLFAAYEDGGQPAWLGSSEPLGRYWWPPEIHQTGGMTVSDVMQAFARAWSTDDDAGRLRLLTAACVPGVVLVAPQATLTGNGALSASIREFRQACPAAAVTFVPTDKHGGFLRVAWVTRWNTGQLQLPRNRGERIGFVDAQRAGPDTPAQVFAECRLDQ